MLKYLEKCEMTTLSKLYNFCKRFRYWQYELKIKEQRLGLGKRKVETNHQLISRMLKKPKNLGQIAQKLGVRRKLERNL